MLLWQTVGAFTRLCNFLTIRTKPYEIAILNIKGGDKIKDDKKTKELKEFKDIELDEFDIELDELDIELKEIKLDKPKDNANKNSLHW